MIPYYQDDLVTLYHGDCREVTAWLKADVLVTDPPYGVKWTKNAMHYTPTTPAVRDAIANDRDTVARDDALALWGDRPAIVFGSWRMPRPANTRQRLVWHKAASKPAHTTAPWYSADEEIYVIGAGFSGRPEQTVYRTTEARSGSDGLSAQVGHPTPKPLGLMERLVAKCPEGVVADPFSGAGATLLAARNLGRAAIGVELDEGYCELTAKRLSQDTLFSATA